MDALEKTLGEELARDMAARQPSGGITPLQRAANGGPKTTVRLAEQIDLLIADFKLRIDMLQKIKESL